MNEATAQIFETLKRNIVAVLPDLADHSFVMSDQLVELGANSVDRADIVMTTMDELGLRIPRTELAGARNLGDLVNVFSRHSAGK